MSSIKISGEGERVDYDQFDYNISKQHNLVSSDVSVFKTREKLMF